MTFSDFRNLLKLLFLTVQSVLPTDSCSEARRRPPPPQIHPTLENLKDSQDSSLADHQQTSESSLSSISTRSAQWWSQVQDMHTVLNVEQSLLSAFNVVDDFTLSTEQQSVSLQANLDIDLGMSAVPNSSEPQYCFLRPQWCPSFPRWRLFLPAAVCTCPLRLPSERLLSFSGHMQSDAKLSVSRPSSTVIIFVNPVMNHWRRAILTDHRVLTDGQVDKALAHHSLRVSLHAKKLSSVNTLFQVWACSSSGTLSQQI